MKDDTLKSYRERVLKVLVHIQHHLDEELGLEDLARIASFSPFHFHRIFRGMVGESVKEHIRRLRLERAALRLKGGTLPVIQVAFEAGFEAHEAFTRAFKAHFGLAPREFRACSTVWSDRVPAARLPEIEEMKRKGRAMQVEIKNLEPMHVAFVRHVGPYDQCGSAWQKLCGWAGPKGLFGPNTRMLGCSYDDPEVTAPDKLRYDACLTVDGAMQAEGEIGVRELEAGEYAVTVHHGPYEKFAKTYAALCGEWIPANGREIRTAPALEFYRNSPEDTAPEDLVTEIWMPLEPAR